MSIAHTALRELVAALARAQRAFDAGDRQAARASVAEALAIDPGNVQALDLLATLEHARTDTPRRWAPRQTASGADTGGRAPAHGMVNTTSWLAFEARVRERRVSRLVAEAEAASRDGRRDDAAVLMAELCSLAPGDERLTALEGTLAGGSASGSGVSPDTARSPLDDPDFRDAMRSREDVAPAPYSRRRGAGSTGALAAAVVLAAVVGGWTAHRHMTAERADRSDDRAVATDLGPLASAARGPAPLIVAPDVRPSEIPLEAPADRVAAPPNDEPQAATTAAVSPPRSAPPPADPAPSPRVPRSLPSPPTTAPAERPVPPPAALALEPGREPARSTGEASVPAPVLADRPLAADAPASAPAAVSSPPAPAAELASAEPASTDARASIGRDTSPPPQATAGTAVAGAVDPAMRPSAETAPDVGARLVLDEYRRAYNDLDAAAAQRVWPTVDSRALDRAFRQLASQAISFERCDVTAEGVSGQAVCRGRASWAPAVGDRNPRQEPRTWRFTLSQRGERWVITNVRVER